MHTAIRHERNIVVLLFFVGISKLVHNNLRGLIDRFFVNKHINITACPHPRLGVILPYHRPFERYKRDFRFIQDFAQSPKLIVYLLISVNCEHHLFLKFCLDFTISDKVVFYQRVADKMGKVMGF